jgi:RNA polymerase sigma-70 factor (ECF subfamily)
VAAGRAEGDGAPDLAPTDLAAIVTPSAPEVPPTREAPDGELAAAVDEAVIGDVFADLPEAQPDRTLTSATDISSLYVRHRSGMAAHARRFLRDSRDVDEVVQETFLRLFLAIDEIETELQAIAFARRTLTNLCIDRYRADRRRPTLVNLDAAPVGELASDVSDDDPVLRAEDAAIVREALARLSPLHRAALVKREIEEKPLPQIAAELDIPEESVKHLLFRARRSLRRLLVGTSVEPGVDLTAAEIADIANRRAAAALMRGANVFIVIVVGAIVAAVGMRALEGRPPATSTPSGAVDGGQSALGGSVLGSKSGHPRHPVQLHLLSPQTAPHDTTSPPVGAAPAHPTVVPMQQAPLRTGQPTKPTKPTAGTFGASRSHFTLSGPLDVRATPQVDTTPPVVQDGGLTTSALSSFSAPTSAGTFQLAQTVATSAVQGDSVSVTPSFIVGNQVETPTITGTAASVSTQADGSVTVSVVSNTQPNSSTNAFPLTSLTVHLVLSADLGKVVTETVALSTLRAAAPTSPGSTSPSACPAGSLPAADGQCLSMAGSGPPPPPATADTSSGQSPGSQAALPGVLEISGMSEDDRAAARAFTTSGGASS